MGRKAGPLHTGARAPGVSAVPARCGGVTLTHALPEDSGVRAEQLPGPVSMEGCISSLRGPQGGDAGPDLRGRGGPWRLVMLATSSSLGSCREPSCRVGDGGWAEEHGRVMGVLSGQLVVVHLQ